MVQTEQTQSRPQAVIFTHCSDLRYDDPKTNYPNHDPKEIDPHYFDNNVTRYIELYAERFKAYLACNRVETVVDGETVVDAETLVGIVYGYVDIGLRDVVKTTAKPGQPPFDLDPQIIPKERRLKDVLRQAEQKARMELGILRYTLPKFHFIGLSDLLGLLNNLVEVDPTLLNFLSGIKDGVRLFTYDSPKFVEAVIRLARGDIPHLAQHPVVRVDDDAKVNPDSLRLLIDKFTQVSSRRPFYFFSGRYGQSDSSYDPANDYAVRTHWFFPPGTQCGDERFTNNDQEFERRIDLAHKFLADLAVLGATQPRVPEKHRSRALRNLIEEGKVSEPRPRPEPQVISGAGLIMGRRNIELLPPFMDFNNLTVWVDDHLKRRLHEMLGDIFPSHRESVSILHNGTVEFAKFEQCRHPNGIAQRDILKPSWYLERLLRGCLFHAIIINSTNDKEGPLYSELIRDIVWFKKGRSDVDEAVRESLKTWLRRVANQWYTVVLSCWHSEEFEGFTSFDWAQNLLNIFEAARQENPEHTPELCEQVVGDAMLYIDLLLEWHIFTRAIIRLPFLGNSWLFERVELHL